MLRASPPFCPRQPSRSHPYQSICISPRQISQLSIPCPSLSKHVKCPSCPNTPPSASPNNTVPTSSLHQPLWRTMVENEPNNVLTRKVEVGGFGTTVCVCVHVYLRVILACGEPFDPAFIELPPRVLSPLFPASGIKD